MNALKNLFAGAVLHKDTSKKQQPRTETLLEEITDRKQQSLVNDALYLKIEKSKQDYRGQFDKRDETTIELQKIIERMIANSAYDALIATGKVEIVCKVAINEKDVQAVHALRRALEKKSRAIPDDHLINTYYAQGKDTYLDVLAIDAKESLVKIAVSSDSKEIVDSCISALKQYDSEYYYRILEKMLKSPSPTVDGIPHYCNLQALAELESMFKAYKEKALPAAITIDKDASSRESRLMLGMFSEDFLSEQERILMDMSIEVLNVLKTVICPSRNPYGKWPPEVAPMIYEAALASYTRLIKELLQTNEPALISRAKREVVGLAEYLKTGVEHEYLSTPEYRRLEQCYTKTLLPMVQKAKDVAAASTQETPAIPQ